ncbi:hypothetical protein JCM17478_17870 [Thermopirellula anaerolimosa]
MAVGTAVPVPDWLNIPDARADEAPSNTATAGGVSAQSLQSAGKQGSVRDGEAGTPKDSGVSDRVDFAHEIVPILRGRCGQCHLGSQREGGLSLDTRELILESGTVVPGKPEESELLRRVMSRDPDERMPANGPPLTAEQTDLLRRWIAAGMPWEPGFAFSGPSADEVRPLSLRPVALPPETADRKHPIDRLIGAYFDRHGMEFPPAAEPLQWFRRMSYDVIGLPPTEEEIALFSADDSPDRNARWLKRRLDSKREYAEHWLSFWNDLLRNDYTGTGYIDGGRKPITGWLYQALYDNMPYDEFVRQLVAPKPESEGFMRGIKWRGNVNASQRTELQFSQNTAQVFLGINMKCASCHDSFIDHWTLNDAYGLAAITAEEPLEIFRCDKPTGRIAEARFVYPELGDIDAGAPREARLRRYAELLTDPRNGRTARTIVNRIWHRLMGRGIVHPIDEMGRAAWDESLLDYLADYLIQHDWDLKQLIEHIGTSRIYAAVSVPFHPDSADGYIFEGPHPKRLTAEQFVDTLRRLTGTGPEKPAFPPPVEEKPTWFRASLTAADRLQLALGRPMRDVVVTTRPEDVTTLQALDLAIGPEFHEALQQGAGYLKERFKEESPDALIRHVFLSTLTRPPTDRDIEIARSILRADGEGAGSEAPETVAALNANGIVDFLWAVFMLPEFQTVY